ncbi:MAG: twin transmembrane helix small protein [Alphaproteobacteria bacterium]
MNNMLFILIILSLFSVVAVLAMGIFSMIKGGEFNEKHGNKLMRLRIILQALAVLLLAFAAFLSQN